jgi:hypothetical protein
MAAAPPVVDPPERVWTEEEKAARRARYEARDAEVRERRAERVAPAADAEKKDAPAKTRKRASRKKKPADMPA